MFGTQHMQRILAAPLLLLLLPRCPLQPAYAGRLTNAQRSASSLLQPRVRLDVLQGSECLQQGNVTMGLSFKLSCRLLSFQLMSTVPTVVTHTTAYLCRPWLLEPLIIKKHQQVPLHSSPCLLPYLNSQCSRCRIIGSRYLCTLQVARARQCRFVLGKVGSGKRLITMSQSLLHTRGPLFGAGEQHQNLLSQNSHSYPTSATSQAPFAQRTYRP